MHLTTAEIDRYGPLYDWRPPCQDGLTVLSGPNEAGKTLYLEALLQLLEPDVVDVMDPSPRVTQSPTGRVVLEHNGKQHECDGEISLTDISAIEPAHLQSIFVVRDNDLQLPSEQEYYTSLIEKLGDIHTTEITKIKSTLKDRGRLTDTRLNISSDQDYDDAGDVRNRAAALAEDIRSYVLTIDDEQLDELDSRRLRTKRRLQDARGQLQTQQEAKRVADYERLFDQLSTYRSTSETLAGLSKFDRSALEELRVLQNDLNRDRTDREEIIGEIADAEEKVEQTAAALEAAQEKQAELERREGAVSEAKSALDGYREQQEKAAGAERQLALSKPATIAGLIAAGGAGIVGGVFDSTGAVGLGLGLLVVSIFSGTIYYRANQRLTAVNSSREAVLQTARDAGLDVEMVEDVAPAIESFQGSLSTANNRAARKEQAHRNAKEDLSSHREEKTSLTEQIADQEEELEELLSDAGVDSIDTFDQKVERREQLTQKQQLAQQSLVDRFGEPDVEDPEVKAQRWEQDLESLVSDIDIDEVEADAYDEENLEQLEEEIDELEGTLDYLETKLDAYDEHLDGFADDARDLDTRPFIGEQVFLKSRSKEGLESLASDLGRVKNRIEEDAEVSRKALEVFNRIEQQEEQKLTELFDPDGPASRTFEQLTGGRYTQVGYDAETHDIVVHRQDGRTFTPSVLSQGTKDQLYFATRVSLAQQLLGSQPGFFFLDDPFLAADPDRLRQGFQTLQELAENGWQIMYLTAKQEVSEGMVEEYNLDHMGMESLANNT